MGGTRRRRVEPTDEWEQLKLLCRWPEQLAYEEIRPTVLFGSSVRDWAEETGSSERTLYRKAARFDREGIGARKPKNECIKRPGLPEGYLCNHSNFRELRHGEVRRTPLPGTSVNSAGGLLAGGALPVAPH
jgi:hypothetical protein